MQNISPAHASDIEVYIDAITIVFEKASKGGQPVSLPIACTEAGSDHSLPNLVLRLFSYLCRISYQIRLLLQFICRLEIKKKIINSSSP